MHENNRKLTLSLDGAIKKVKGTAINTETDFEESATKLQKLMTLDALSSRVIYQDILDGVDLEYIVDSYDIKENIIVKEKNDNYRYTFTLKLNNLTAALNSSGDVVISDSSTDEIVYIIPAPVVYDASDVYASFNTAEYTLVATGINTYSLSVTVDSNWMNDEDRVYPIVVDPPISIPSSSVTDLDIYSTNADRTSPTDTTMYVSSTWHSYWKLSSLPAIPKSAYITSARISLRSTSTTGSYIGAYQVITDWDSTLTWNKTIADELEGKLSTSLLDYNCINSDSTNSNRFYWDITSLVRSWYLGTANYGVGFKPVSGTDASSESVFSTSEASNSSYYPQFTITYKDMKGVESYWSYATQDVGLAGTGSINYSTGTLTFSKSLLSTTDSLMQYTPMIVYNSTLAATPYKYPNVQTSYWGTYMPHGFKLSIQETIIKKQYTNSAGESVYYYIWSDGDGTEHYFLPVEDSSTEYRDEDGLQLTLDTSSTKLKITDSNDTIRTYSKLSSTPNSEVLGGWYLSSITDVNDNKITFSFDSGLRPTTISLTPNGSTAIDFLTIVYNSSYVPIFIVNRVSGEAIMFRYSTTATGDISSTNTNYLREIEYAHSSGIFTVDEWTWFYNDPSITSSIIIDATAYYTYDNNGYLINVKDGLSDYQVNYTYSNGKVTTVQEYGVGNIIGQKLNISYYSGYTEARTSGSDDVYGNSDDIYNRFVFDNEGRTVTSYSTNLARTEIYGVSNGEYETDNVLANNSIKVSSTTGGTSANYVLNGSFEKSDTSASYWHTVGTVDISKTGDGVLDDNHANLIVSSNTESSIYQYTYLRSGDYTLSFNINTFESEDLTIKVIAQSMSDSTRVFEKEIPYNRYYASGQAAFDYFAFTAQNGEIFKINISVVGGESTALDTYVTIDDIMLAKSSGAHVYNMVQNGDFENTSVTSSGSVRYSPSTFWKMSSDSSADSIIAVSSTSPFYKTLRLKGEVDSKQVAEHVIYSASDAILGAYSQGYGATSSPQVFKVSGFGRATSIMHSPDAVFALRLDVTYYLGDGESKTESKHFNFCEDNTNWQYVNDTFIIPEYSMIQEIKVCCEYSGNVGYAYFDNISVIHESDGSTSQYVYDEKGRTKLSIKGNDVVFYNYDEDDNLSEKITRKSRTTYMYDEFGHLISEKYYTYSGYFAYNAEYDRMIELMGTQSLKMQSTYTYDTYGLLISSTVTSTQESDAFVTRTSYNVDDGSRIFGSISTTIDSLGKVTRYFYDVNDGRLLANIQPDNKGTCYSYDSLGNLILVQPATYSSTWSRVSGSANVSYDYNELNQLQNIKTNGTDYTFTYNDFGTKDSVAIGGTTIVSQTYNANNGKISSVTYANETVINYYYDNLERVEKIVYNNDGVESIYEYEYDANGNLGKFIDNSIGRITVYKYDDSGRMTNFFEYDSEENVNLSSAWYTYDDHSRLSMIFYDQDYVYNSSDYYSSSYYLSYRYNYNDTVSRYYISAEGGSYTITPNYDGHNRVEMKTIKLSQGTNSATNNVSYKYKTNGLQGSTVVSQYQTQINYATAKVYNFTYDSANANITKVTDESGTILNQYTYDTLGRLTREDNKKAGKTYVYTYDSDGNILTKKTYGFTTASGTPTTTLYSTYNYTYSNVEWGDQLTVYRGYSITYDAIGNPTSYYNGYRMYMNWTNGNNLESVTKNSTTTTYIYNDKGIRTSKIVDGVRHTYLLDGSVILSEEYDGKLFLYMYDENGTPIGIHYREDSYDKDVFDCYLFEKNFQGDIIGIYNKSGTQIAWYEYDAWGNRVYGAYLSGYSDIFNANPFRYRGYYYDSETGFYYCGSRYYDPVIGRFISADNVNTLMNTPMAYTDKNLYAYCDNNPVMRVDNGGEFWDTVFDVISLCASVVDVVKNPDDPWAWVGLAADVVSLAVPFATGGGLLVDVFTKSDDVIDFAKSFDKVKDTAKKVGNGIKKVVDKIADCFVAGTMVATEEGHLPIENIKIGDYVWATDPETGETALKQVVNTFINETTAVTHVTINGEVITSTQTHPYYVANAGWVLAKNLRAGDILVMLNGEQVILELVQHEILESPIVTYNFEVEDFHTYYVGENDVLVHNKCFRG